MGCAQSRVDNEESVSRCKDRRNLMKEAVVARNAFAASHSSYAIALKNTGAALSDYGHGESDYSLHHDQQQNQPMDSTPQPPPPPPIDNLPPPPPPLPNFSPSPIKRAISMPAIPINTRKPGSHLHSAAITEEEEEEEEIERQEEEQGDDSERNRKSEFGGGTHMEAKMPLQEVTPQKNMAWDYFFVVDNMPGPSLVDGGMENENRNVNEESVQFTGIPDMGVGNSDEMEPKTPEKGREEKDEEEEEEMENGVNKEKQKIEHSKTAPPDFRRIVKGVSGLNLVKVLTEIDDQFLKASESAQEVSKMLEATRLHYHSNFADNRGNIDHSARVMRVITWNRSFRGIPNGEGGKDDFDSEEYETHATVLDKLLAWDKKLYEEVKQGELMKLEYQKKVTLLNKQKKRNAGADTLEKTKAAVSHLHTRYIVDMQSMDSTVSEVNRLRDEQLYPKLVALVEGMAEMWGNMCVHHDSQLKIVSDLKSIDIAHSPKETSKHHHERTQQLLNVVQEWHTQFEKLVTHQKQYIQSLTSWLKLNLIPIESNLKEKISSPPRLQNPPIQALLRTWNDHLEKLPDEVAKSAISSFAAVIKTIILHQEEEMKLKEKLEETRKEFLRKNQVFEEWYQKYLQRRMSDETGEEANPNDPVSERKFVVESLRKKLEEETEAHQRHCLQVREKSLGSLKIRLPELFRAMSDYAHACSDAYERLRSLTHSQKSNGGSI